VAAYRRAIEVDPKFEPALNNLGNVLSDQGRFDEAIALYKKAIELNPKMPLPWNNMGNALRRKKQFDEAIANCRKAVELDPNYAVAHHNIGLALADQGRLVEAVAAYRKAIELEPRSAATYFDLGYALGRNGQTDEAIAAYRKAVEIDPKNVNAYINQGSALISKKRWAEAVAAFRKAVELEPKRVHAQANLGVALLNKGLTDEAVERLHAAVELDPDDLEVRKILEATTRLAAGRDKVARFRNGDFTPADNADRLEMVDWCQFLKLNYTATKLLEAVIAADPKAADDVKAGHRYNAACYATLAADRQGADAGALDESARTRFRRQALDWIRADLAGWTKKLASDKAADRAEIAQYVGHWQKDPDLISVRDEGPLMKLSAEERAAFTTLWTDVAALLKKCEPTKGDMP
jgi:tetratricopeptide (TPR) repeat protein